MSIPHSGTQIPLEAKWLKNISPSILMSDVDRFVDDLYHPALSAFKIPSVIFKWHRYALDANRLATDISPLTVKGAQQKPKNSKEKSPSDIHWHKSSKGDLLITDPLPKELSLRLIQNYFEPFHQKIQQMIDRLKSTKAKVYLLDLHSMPSKGLAFHRDPGERRKQIVIGDRNNHSCSSSFRDLIITAYEQAGFELSLNWPYKGGAITQKYGRPDKGQEVLQVELNRQLYMDEKSGKKSPHYQQVQNQLKQAIAFIFQNLK